jgi:hypothetical protein
MKYKDISVIVFWHALLFLGGTVFFLLMFRSTLFSDLVLFYRGIILIFLTGIVLTAVFYLILRSKYRGNLTFRDLIISLLLMTSVNIVFFTHVPVTADRSVTIFVLGYMNSNPEKVYTKNELEDVFIDKYIDENDGMDKRSYEQVVSGNINEVDEGFKLTRRGKLLIKLYIMIADLFDLEKKNLSL